MKEVQLIEGNWYEINYSGTYRWIFKLKEFKTPNKLWNTLSATPHDGYTDSSKGYIIGKPEDCKPADMEEVYKLFPDERTKIYSWSHNLIKNKFVLYF